MSALTLRAGRTSGTDTPGPQPPLGFSHSHADTRVEPVLGCNLTRLHPLLANERAPNKLNQRLPNPKATLPVSALGNKHVLHTQGYTLFPKHARTHPVSALSLKESRILGALAAGSRPTWTRRDPHLLAKGHRVGWRIEAVGRSEDYPPHRHLGASGWSF